MNDHTVIQIADWFLSYVRCLNMEEDEEPLSLSKLQMLLYCAQGVALVLWDKPLFQDTIIRGKRCPMIESIDQTLLGDRSLNPILDPEVIDLLTIVYQSFGCYSTLGLKSILYQDRRLSEVKLNETIHPETIRSQFESLCLIS